MGAEELFWTNKIKAIIYRILYSLISFKILMAIQFFMMKLYLNIKYLEFYKIEIRFKNFENLSKIIKFNLDSHSKEI